MSEAVAGLEVAKGICQTFLLPTVTNKHLDKHIVKTNVSHVCTRCYDNTHLSLAARKFVLMKGGNHSREAHN